MASTHETRFGSLVMPRLQGQFGESVTYTPKGGVATAIAATVIRIEAQELGPGGLRIEEQHELWVSSSDISNARRGDSVALLKKSSDLATTTMQVTRVIANASGWWHLALQ